MHTKKLLLGGALLAIAAAANAENKTAVTAVENIKLDGVTVPLNIKTLAEIQRLQEEQAMREELKAAIKASGTADKTAPVQAAKPAAVVRTAPRITPRPVPSKLSNVARPNTLLGVYGPNGAMTAEIQTTDRSVRTLREGGQLGKFQIRRISSDGLELAANNGGTQYVSVGAQVRF